MHGLQEIVYANLDAAQKAKAQAAARKAREDNAAKVTAIRNGKFTQNSQKRNAAK